MTRIGKCLYCDGEFELDLMSKVLGFLRGIQKCPPKGEGTILDIGANIGVISIGMLYAGEVRHAIAIEPEPRNFSLLQRNSILNGLGDRIICLPYAVSHQKTEIQFELSDSNFGDHRVRSALHRADLDSGELYSESGRRVIAVQSNEVDALLGNLPETITKDITLLWVDVQGHEGYVFMGAKKLLSKGIPVVAEIWPYGIRRAGMSQEQFLDIAKSHWTSFWVWRRVKFVRYPIDTLDILFDELGDDAAENIIFM